MNGKLFSYYSLDFIVCIMKMLIEGILLRKPSFDFNQINWLSKTDEIPLKIDFFWNSDKFNLFFRKETQIQLPKLWFWVIIILSYLKIYK